MPCLAASGRALLAGLALLTAACSPAQPALGMAGAGGAPSTDQAEAGPVRLGAGPARIALTIPPGLRQAVAGGASAVLVIDRLTADRQPGVLYRVEIEGAAPPLGHLNLYNAVTGGPAEFRFPLPTGALPPEGKPLIVIVTPESAPDPDARVLLGRVALTWTSQP
jgi:hypothetical protein